MTNCKKSVNSQEKIACFSPLFVARTISSRLKGSAGGSQKAVKVAAKATCSICFEETDAQLMFTVDGCLHQYCAVCMKQHVEVKLLQGTLPKCPYEDCKSRISIDSCQELLEPKLLAIMSQRVKEVTIPASEKIYCPFPTCSVLMSESEIRNYSKKSVRRRERRLGAGRCTNCQGLLCVECKVHWHSAMTCQEYQQFRSTLHTDMRFKSLQALAMEQKWRQCPNCSNMVELGGGCYHITCRCKHEFCYLCGAEWKNKKRTCSCKLWDELT